MPVPSPTPTPASEASIEAFCELLSDLSIHKKYIAANLDIPAHTVSRWAARGAKPSLENIERALEVISARVDEMKRKIDHTRSVLAPRP